MLNVFVAVLTDGLSNTEEDGEDDEREEDEGSDEQEVQC
jgi:hypothetical protein